MKEHRDTATLAPLFRRHTRRPRLTRLLDEATAQTILVTAPAGYGKTTLAQEWLQGRSNIAWYGATSASADLAAFSTGIADVVDPIVPRAGDRLRQRLRVGDAPDKAVRPLAELMGEDLREWPTDAWLVIDDYHLVMESTLVEEFVDWLLTLAPVRLLVTSRRRPAWASARRVLYGEIVEIDRDQLAMNDQEAGRVLSNRSDAAVRALVRQAEGWPALIGLAALSATLELPEERVSDALFRYFAEEVLRREPPEVQQFMLIASIPATINARVAREVLGYQDPEPILERLRAEDILQDGSDDELHFHPLLRDFLRRRIESGDPSDYERRSLEALEDARRRGRWEEALDIATQLNHPASAAQVIGDAADALLASGRVETLEKWLQICGPSLHTQPGAVLAHAEVLTRRGRLSEAAVIAQNLTASLDPEDQHISRAACVAGQALHLISDDEGALAWHFRAKGAARSQDELEHALWGCFIAAGELELPEASDYLDEFARIQAPSIDSRLRLAVGRVLAAQRNGSYAGLAKMIDPLVPLASQAMDPMIRSSFLSRAADLSVARAHYHEAQTLVQQALDVCTDLNLEFATNLCLLIRANAEIGLREIVKARHTLDELSARASNIEDPYVDLGIKLILIKIGLANGVLDDVLAAGEPPSDALQKSGQGEFWGLLAIAAAVSGDLDEARYRAQRSQAVSRAVEPLYYARFADILAEAQQGRDEGQLISSVSQLVRDCADDDALDALVIAYRAYPPLLRLAKGAFATTLVKRVLVLSCDRALARKMGILLPSANDYLLQRGELTPRELEVLSLLRDGLTNSEIARKLFISESTAKVHVHHVLKKLGVTNRLRAALKASEFLGGEV